MKILRNALFASLLILVCGRFATAAPVESAISHPTSDVSAITHIQRVSLRFPPSSASHIASVAMLSAWKHGGISTRQGVRGQTDRGGEVLLGDAAGSPGYGAGLLSSTISGGGNMIQLARVQVLSFAASLPDSPEPGLLLVLGTGLMGASLLLLRRRRAVPA